MKTEEDREQRQTDKRDQREAGEEKKGGDRQTDRRDQSEAREKRRSQTKRRQK